MQQQSSCPDSSGPAGAAASRRVGECGQPDSRPLSRRVSRARWEKALQARARARLEPGWTTLTLAIAFALARYMSATGGNCFPGIIRLAAELLSKPLTVAKHIRLLEAGGYLEVHRGGGRGHRTEYYARLPIGVDQAAPSAPERPLLAAPADVEDLQAPAEAEPAAVQLLSEPPAAAGDVDLVVSEVLDAPASAPAVASSDGAETLSLQGGGGIGVSGTPSCPPPHPGGHAVRPGGTRHAPRPTRPARVPEPVARVIAALPLTEQQRLWARTHSPKVGPSAVEAIADALASTGATPVELARAIDGAHHRPLREADSPGGLVVARIPKALELLELRAAAEAHRRELGAAPSAPTPAKARREVVAALAAEAKAAIAATPDPKAPAPGVSSSLVSAPWDRVSGRPRRVPLPELLARLEGRGGAGAGEDGQAAGLGA